MAYLGDTSMLSSPYPDRLSITSHELDDAPDVNGVDALSVVGGQPASEDLPEVNGHAASNTIGDTYPTGTELSWQDIGRPSLSVTNAPTAGLTRTANAHKGDDVASTNSSIAPMKGSTADTRSVASSMVSVHMTAEKAKLIAHFTSYAEEHTGDFGYGFCNVHERGRLLTEADLAIDDNHNPNMPVAATETLLHKHHDFFLASQHPEQEIPNTHNHLVGESATLPDPVPKAQQHPADSVTDVPATDVEPALGQAVFSMQNTSAIRSSLHSSHTVAGSRLHLTVSRIVLLAFFGILNLVTISLIIWQITLHGTHELKLAKRCILGGALAVIVFTTCIMLTLNRVLHEILLMALVVIAIGMMLPWELDGLM